MVEVKFSEENVTRARLRQGFGEALDFLKSALADSRKSSGGANDPFCQLFSIFMKSVFVRV